MILQIFETVVILRTKDVIKFRKHVVKKQFYETNAIKYPLKNVIKYLSKFVFIIRKFAANIIVDILYNHDEKYKYKKTLNFNRHVDFQFGFKQ